MAIGIEGDESTPEIHIRRRLEDGDATALPVRMSDIDGNATYPNLTRDQRSVIER